MRGDGAATGGYDRYLRWYPDRWRARYGDEMAALLEDTYATATAVPRRQRAAMARHGLSERARAGGLLGEQAGPVERMRAGSLLVLCGWALCLVGVAVFGKLTDNWFAHTPAAGRWLAGSGFGAVLVSGLLGCLCVLVAALVVVPAFVRLLRAGRWREVRTVVASAMVSAAVAVALFGGVVAWAHHLGTHDRNGGLPVYGAAFLVAGLSVVAALVCATAAALAVARRVELGAPALRALARLALGLTALMALALAGLVTWWVSEAVHASRVLSGGIGNGMPYASATVPPTLLAAGCLVALGLGLGLWGSGRVRRALAPLRTW